MTLRTASLWSAIFAAFLAACGTPRPGDREIPVVRLRGSPAEIGRAHGAALADDIRTLYERFLGAQVLPYLNRQQKTVDDAVMGLGRYMEREEYQDGKFAFQFLLDSAETLKAEQPADYLAEIEGIAAGAGISPETALVLNTFGDTLLGMLSLSFYTERKEAPALVSVELPLSGDGRDNDFDGVKDEVDEATIYYEPVTQAVRTGIPAGRLRLRLRDEDGVARANLQVLVNGVALPEDARTYGGGGTEVTLDFDTTPYWRDDWNTLAVQASDEAVVEEPPPVHPHTMRQARLTIGGTQAAGRAVNAGIHDAPGAGVSFAVAAADGSLVARNFVLLDANTAHDHTAVFVFEPAPTQALPKPRRYAVVGWAGASWALTGMNDAGQAVSVNIVETLDNGMARGTGEGDLLKAKGITFGAVGRWVLAHDWSPQEFEAGMAQLRGASGVAVQLADARRKTVTTCELKAGITLPAVRCYGTGATSPAFRPSKNTVAALAAYRAFPLDASGDLLAGAIELAPQSAWSTEWLQSYTTFANLARALAAAPPGKDARKWIEIMRTPGVASLRNSMQSAVMLPDQELWVGVGRLPSTDSKFIRFTAQELFP